MINQFIECRPNRLTVSINRHELYANALLFSFSSLSPPFTTHSCEEFGSDSSCDDTQTVEYSCRRGFFYFIIGVNSI